MKTHKSEYVDNKGDKMKKKVLGLVMVYWLGQKIVLDSKDDCLILVCRGKRYDE